MKILMAGVNIKLPFTKIKNSPQQKIYSTPRKNNSPHKKFVIAVVYINSLPKRQ